MSRPHEKRAYQRTGLHTIGKALSSLHRLRGDAWIDSLGKTGEVLREWRAAIIADLGGEDTISAMQRAVVELATRTYLLLESVDRYLLEQPSLVNKSRRQLFAVVLQRQHLADALARYMGQLGLERRVREVVSITDIRREYEEGGSEGRATSTSRGNTASPSSENPHKPYASPASTVFPPAADAPPGEGTAGTGTEGTEEPDS